jgi:GNAT superfamily N-acetyltransferase
MNEMSLIFRNVNKTDISELRFIGEADARIPLAYDPNYKFAETAIDTRLDYYSQLATDDFFEVVVNGDAVVAFHIVKKMPFPPNLQIGNIVSLWGHPDYRGQGMAAKLKTKAEEWGKKGGLAFMQTNVHKNNQRMLEMNQGNGYESAYILLRKKLTN